MKPINDAKNSDQETNNEESVNLPGYPLYPAYEDIYSQGILEREVNPDDLTTNQTANEASETLGQEEEIDIKTTDYELDIPGAELDDQQEDIGNEDEENNYYSLGGDNHIDLDEGGHL
jgi:hypothetical protein